MTQDPKDCICNLPNPHEVEPGKTYSYDPNCPVPGHGTGKEPQDVRGHIAKAFDNVEKLLQRATLTGKEAGAEEFAKELKKLVDFNEVIDSGDVKSALTTYKAKLKGERK